MRRVLLLPAVLGIVAVAGISSASAHDGARASTDAQLVGAPVLPETVVAPNAPPLGPRLTDGLGALSDRGLEEVVVLPAPSKPDDRTVLVDAQVLSKYQAFRESLTTP